MKTRSALSLKIAFLRACKWVGLFRLASFLYRDSLAIVCYHGFSYADEHVFRPSLFMTPKTFEARLAWLSDHGFNVLDLEQGIDKLYSDSLPRKSVVITIDDGFRSVRELAAPILFRYKFPATLYVTSYYAQKESPVFRLIMQYMAWKSERGTDALGELAAELPLERSVDNDEPKRRLLWSIIEYAEEHLTDTERTALARRTAVLLDIDYDSLRDRGFMCLCTADEIRALPQRGISVELHTHRHFLPDEKDGVAREIRDNRDFLEPLLRKRLRHFCYPSGVWNRGQWSILEDLGIESATICAAGMNSRATSRMALNRFLDREDVCQPEFEAELCGFKQLIRDIRSRFSKFQKLLSGSGVVLWWRTIGNTASTRVASRRSNEF